MHVRLASGGVTAQLAYRINETYHPALHRVEKANAPGVPPQAFEPWRDHRALGDTES